MSVINDMLKDLEQRRYTEDPSSTSKFTTVLQPATNIATQGSWIWWLLGMVGVSLLGGIGWVYSKQVSNESAAILAPPTESATQAAQPLLLDQPRLPSQELLIPVKDSNRLISTFKSEQPSPTVCRIELWQHDWMSVVELEFNQPLSVSPMIYRQGDHIWLRLFKAEASQVVLPELTKQMPISEWLVYLEDGYQMIKMRVGQSIEEDLLQLRPGHWRLTLQSKAMASEVRVDAEQEDQQLKEPDVPATPISSRPVPAGEAQDSVLTQVKKTKHNYKAAEQAWVKGHKDTAEKLLKEVLAQKPEHLPASLLLSQLYLMADRPGLVEPVILSALQHHHEQPELVSYFVRSLLAQGRLDAAGDYLSRTMQAGYAAHLGLQAAIRQRQGQHSEARDYYQQALKAKPDEVTWLVGLAISQEHLGGLAMAREAYQRALITGKLNQTLQGFVQDRLALQNNSKN